jgi:outer membrane protein OmpA-like peptidoglycan-associated protein
MWASMIESGIPAVYAARDRDPPRISSTLATRQTAICRAGNAKLLHARNSPVANAASLAQLASMRAKNSPAFMVAALGLLVGCGPIAFNDTINFAEAKPAPEPKPTLEASPEPETKPRTVPARARLTGDRIVIDEMIQFEYDSAEIKPESHGILDEVVKVLTDNPRVEKLDIVGHTSSEGSDAHNNELSTNRAASVKQYLIDHGIDAARLTSQGKGESDPLESNDTEEGKIANRRVEFKVTKMAGGARAKPTR